LNSPELHRATLATRRGGWPGLAVLLGLAAIVTVLFAATPLDLVAARVFYRPDALDHWPLAKELPWSVLYRLAPWITAALVLSGLAALALGIARGHSDWRRHGIFLLLSIVVGPGLLVNTVFKDHWGRPRPRDVVEFGGPLHYRIAPLPGGEGGASFPCGHCSVGFLFAAGWWMWKQRRPAWAWGSLVLGLLAGGLLLVQIPTLRAAGLLAICIWSFCRFYYYLFYVLDRYLGREKRFAGVFDALGHLLFSRSPKSTPDEKG